MRKSVEQQRELVRHLKETAQTRKELEAVLGFVKVDSSAWKWADVYNPTVESLGRLVMVTQRQMNITHLQRPTPPPPPPSPLP